MPAARPWPHRPALPLLWGVAWLAACAEDPEQARQAEIRRTWERSPDEAIALVNQLDELEQLTIVERVFEPWGGMGAGGAPCERLDRPLVRDRCKRVMSRVHLAFYRERRQADVDEERACLQRAGADLAQQDTPFGLAMAVARERDRVDFARGLAACRCLQDESQRDECIFNLAETLARMPDFRAEAVDACVLLQPRVVPMCVEHALSLADVHVDLAQTTDACWTEAEQFATHLQRAPQEVTQDSADGLLGFFWSYVMFKSVAAALELPDGQRVLAADLEQHLPPEALPHLRAALAWAVVATAPGGAPDADAALAHTRAVLQGSAPLPGVGSGQRPAFPMGCGPLGEPKGGDGTRHHHLTRLVESRLGSTDPETDLALAVAAAQACLDPARRPPAPPAGGPPPPPPR